MLGNGLSFRKAASATILFCIAMLPVAGCGWLSSSGSGTAPQPAPTMIFSTYLGGSTAFDPSQSPLTFAQNAASDASGNTYVTGATTCSDLPVLNAWQQTPASGSLWSAFVAKLDPAGRLLWCTYLGGDQQSLGLGAAVMPDGGVAVVGLTSSDPSGPFPVMHAFQSLYSGQTDYFVTVYDASGNMRYSTYLGGSDVEGTGFADDGSNGNNIAVDANGLVYVTGVTASGGSGAIKFPATPNAIQSDLKGSTDAFLTIIDPSKSGASSLVYSSFLGGNHDDDGHVVAVNASGGQITVGGHTRSTDFPTTPNAYRNVSAPSTYQGNGFISQFTCSQPGDPNAQYLFRYSTYLGSAASLARDDLYGLAVDQAGVIVVTGRTESPDFPMTNPGVPTIYNSAPYLNYTSGDMTYLAKINPSLSGNASLVYSTFLGGSRPGVWGTYGINVGIAASGAAYIGGRTYASQGVEYTPSTIPAEAPQPFPYTANAFQPASNGNSDAILMQISPCGGTLAYSTFLGGSGADCAYGLAVDPAGNILLSGASSSSDFPLKNQVQNWPGNIGQKNAFVTKFAGFSP